MHVLTLQQLCTVMPRLKGTVAGAFLPELRVAMHGAAIDQTALRTAAFLAQLAHESGELRRWEELSWTDARGRKYPDCYEGRKDLGNTQKGDGVRFKGRGPIQLTGRANYRAAGQALGIDLERQPQRAAHLDVGFKVAAWFWTTRDLNPIADAGDFELITRRVNGGLNGWAHRLEYYARAREVLGC